MALRSPAHLPGPVLWMALGAAIAAACATNPVTGDREFVAISEAQELSIGREADVEIRSQMGVYADEGLQAFVAEVGHALAAVSHRPDLDWHFAVVDSPAVNAFALPGGYIYLTRGIMAHLNDEAELAGVLGHEIAHVTARHSVQAYSRAFGANLGLLAAQIFVPAMRSPYGGPGLGDAAGNGLGLLMLRFGRDDELQADRLGAEYAVASGWDPHGVGDMLATLARIAETSDRRGVPNWLSTHPEPGSRVVEAAATRDRLLADVDPAALRVARAAYLDRVDGLVYGDNPEDGIVRGRDFLHPELLFAVTFPEGWEVSNSPAAVVARQPGRDNYLLLTLAEDPGGELPRIAEREMLAAGYHMRQGNQTSINGLDAYVGTWTGTGRGREPVIAQVAYIRSGRSVYVLGGFAPADEFSYIDREVDASIRTFRALGRDEAESIRPNRIAIYDVQAGDTWQRIALRAGKETELASKLAILNGYPVYEQPAAGDLIKIVVPG
ncbi:MAG: M48 family metalloprotease [Acidobacteria bacterium]|nr:M48 family metalloprotease [Acidobacteriota bacterium]